MNAFAHLIGMLNTPAQEQVEPTDWTPGTVVSWIQELDEIDGISWVGVVLDDYRVAAVCAEVSFDTPYTRFELIMNIKDHYHTVLRLGNAWDEQRRSKS